MCEKFGLGLALRESVYPRLPVEFRERLFLSQVLELTRLRDPTQRARVAQAAVAEDWSVTQLRAAVTAVRAGLPLDADPNAPGTQVPEVPEVPTVALRLAPGRMVTRGEKLATQLDAWATGMETVNVAKLNPAQRQRMTAAVAKLEARVAKLKAGLAGGTDE